MRRSDLLAKAVYKTPSMVNVIPSSRASPLPQGDLGCWLERSFAD